MSLNCTPSEKSAWVKREPYSEWSITSCISSAIDSCVKLIWSSRYFILSFTVPLLPPTLVLLFWLKDPPYITLASSFNLPDSTSFFNLDISSYLFCISTCWAATAALLKSPLICTTVPTIGSATFERKPVGSYWSRKSIELKKALLYLPKFIFSFSATLLATNCKSFTVFL